MNKTGKITLLVIITLYVIVRGLREANFPLPGFLHDYFTDLLYLPLMLLLCLWGTRILKRDSRWFVPVSYVAILTGFTVFLFEYYLPGRKTNFTADPLDCVMYALGGAIFLFFQRKVL